MRVHEEKAAEYRRKNEEYRQHARDNPFISRSSVASQPESAAYPWYPSRMLPQPRRGMPAGRVPGGGGGGSAEGTGGAFRVCLEKLRVGGAAASIDTMRQQAVTRRDAIIDQRGGIQSPL